MTLTTALNSAAITGEVKAKPPAWKLAKLDERYAWNTTSPDGKFFLDHTESVFGLYAFDSSSHTYCAEITPSYELHRVGSDFTLNEAGRALSDEDRERLCAIQDEADVHSDDLIYMHVGAVERMVGAHPANFKDVEVDQDTLDADDPTLAAADEIRERVCTGSLNF